MPKEGGDREEIRTSGICLDGLDPPTVFSPSPSIFIVVPSMMRSRARFARCLCCLQRPLQRLLVDGAKEQVQKEASSMELGKEDHEGDRFYKEMLDRALARCPMRFLQSPPLPARPTTREPLSSILKTVARQTATIFTFQGRTCNSF